MCVMYFHCYLCYFVTTSSDCRYGVDYIRFIAQSSYFNVSFWVARVFYNYLMNGIKLLGVCYTIIR